MDRRALIGYSNSEYALLFTPETRSAFASDNIEVFSVRRSQLFVLYYFIALVYTLKNHSPKCWWQVTDIYLTASQLGKYPPSATSTLVNSCEMINCEVSIMYTGFYAAS